jgi:hypothetical protein
MKHRFGSIRTHELNEPQIAFVCLTNFELAHSRYDIIYGCDVLLIIKSFEREMNNCPREDIAPPLE